jgi:hypothetical protein
MCVCSIKRKRFLSDRTDKRILLVGGQKIEYVTKYAHLSYVVNSLFDDTVDIIDRHSKLAGQDNNL